MSTNASTAVDPEVERPFKGLPGNALGWIIDRVNAAELLIVGEGRGQERKEFVVKAVLFWLDQLDVPLVPYAIEHSAKRLLVEGLVDLVARWLFPRGTTLAPAGVEQKDLEVVADNPLGMLSGRRVRRARRR